MLWSGSIASIPTTWRLCDGTRKTPDLRDAFLLGAGNTYSVDDTGGSLTHVHDFTGDGHDHDFNFGAIQIAGAGFDKPLNSTQVIGTTDADNNLPAYHSLVFVQYDGRLL